MRRPRQTDTDGGTDGARHDILGRRLNLIATMLVFIMPLAALSAAIVSGMVRIGPIDRPNSRSSHVAPVPKGGGMGPVVVVMAVIGLVLLDQPSLPEFPVLLLGGFIVASAALLDDIYNLPVRIKFAAQAAAALVVVLGGVSVSQVGPVPLGLFGPVLTFCWIMFATNALNFMDGLNGLVAGVCIIVGLALAGWDDSAGHAVALTLAAGLIGFLPFNFPRARIFLGDVGSQFCGFTLAVLAVVEVQRNTSAGLVVPLGLLVLLFDVGATLIRRLLAHERLTQAHRGHCYQLLHRTGVPAPWVAAGVWAMAAWGVGCAALSWPVAIPLALVPPVIWTGWAWLRARARLENW